MKNAQESLKERTKLHQHAYECFLKGSNDDIRTSSRDATLLRESIAFYSKVLSVERKTMGKTHPQVGRTMVCMSQVYCTLQQYDEALQVVYKAIKILNNGLGGLHPNVATAHMALGRLHLDMKEYKEAIESLQRALKILHAGMHPNKFGGNDEMENTEVGGENLSIRLTIASVWNAMGVVHATKGDFGSSLECYQETLSIHSNLERLARLLPSSSSSKSKTNKGFHHLSFHFYTFSRIMMDQHGKFCDNEVPVMAVARHNIGGAYQALEDYAEAVDAYEGGLQVLKEKLGSKHGCVASMLVRIGVVHQSSRRYEKALSAFQEALGIQQLVLGCYHVKVALTLRHLAQLYETRGMLNKALDTYHKALATQRKTVCTSHIMHAELLNKIGSIHERVGQVNEALIFHSESLRIYKQNEDSLKRSGDINATRSARDKVINVLVAAMSSVGAEHLSEDGIHKSSRAEVTNSFGLVMDELGETHASGGNYKRALEAYEDSLNFLRKDLGHDHVEVGVLLGKISSLHEKERNYDEALILNSECLRIFRVNGLSYQHPSIIEIIRARQRIESVLSSCG